MASCAHCHSPISDDAVFCPECGDAVSGAVECEGYEYEAFVSYRHLPHDTAVAKRIQHFVEGFRVPKDLAGGRAGRKLGRLFRDEDELPTSASLSEQIDHALEHSRFLVVVCTPDTLQSRWVQQEVRRFAELHGRDRIFVALAQAEPDDSFPPLLLRRKVVALDGSVREEPVEPLAADFRDERKHRQEALRLVAAMLGCGYDDLRQRQRARRNRTVALVASIVAAVAIAFGAVSAYQQAQIAENYRQMQIKESEFLANEANELLAQGDRYQAIQVALAALPSSSTSNERPFVPAAQLALENALQVFPANGDWLACYSQTDVDAWNSCYSEQEGLIATISEGRYVEIREIESGDLVQRIDVHDFSDVTLSSNDTVGMAFAGDRLLYAYNEAFGCFSVRTGEMQWRHDANDDMMFARSLATSPDGSFAAVASLSSDYRVSKVQVYEVSSGKKLTEYLLSSSAIASDSAVLMCFSPDGNSIALAGSGAIGQLNLKTGKSKQRQLGDTSATRLSYVGNRLALVSDDGEWSASESAKIELFSEDLELLWDKTLPRETIWDAAFQEFNSNVEVVGVWDYALGKVPDGDKTDYEVVVSAGRSVILFNVKTGKEVFRKTFKTPVVECAVLSQSDGKSFIAYVTGEGDVSYAAPNKGGENANLDVFLERNLGRLYRADCIQLADRWFLSAWHIDPIKHAMYRNVDLADLSNAERADEKLQDASYYWDERCMVSKTDTILAAFDALSFEPMASVNLASINQLADTVNVQVTASDTDRMYIAGQAREEGEPTSAHCVFMAFDEQTGEPVFECEPADRIMTVGYSIDEIDAYYDDSTQTNLLLVRDDNSITLIEAEDQGQVLLNVGNDGDTRAQSFLSSRAKGGTSEGSLLLLPGRGYMEDAVIVGQNLIVLSSRAVDGSSGKELRVFVIDWRTGEFKLQETDLCKCIGKANGSFDVSSDGDRLVIACEDGKTRAFDVQSGVQLWESTDIPVESNCLKIVHRGDVFFQDPSGICALASGETGRKLCVASVQLPALRNELIYDEETNTVAAFRVGTIFRNVGGTAFISLDQDAFGPISYINHGMVAVPKSERALMEYGYSSEYIVRRLSLDELIDLAHQKIQGHELTDTERKLYHIDFN